MNEGRYSYMDQYCDRLDAAKRALIDKFPDFDRSWFDEIERGVRNRVEEIYQFELEE